MSYDAAQIKALHAKGETMPDGSYPVANAADLDRAIDAVGRGNADHDAIRKYLIGRAKALGLESKIPSDWNADGSEQGRSAFEIDGTMFRSLENSDIELRGQGDGRTLAGILVPYSAPQRVSAPGFVGVEEFVPGAFADQARALTPERLAGGTQPIIPLAHNHVPLGGVTIGRVTNLREDSLGLYGEARVSNTTGGNDVLALIGDGLLREWSVGFKAQQNRAAGAVTQRVKAHLTELAIVAHGAYGPQAAVASVRAALTCPSCAALAASRAEPVEDNAVEPQTAISNAVQASRLIAQLPMLSLNGPAGAPGGPASTGNAATWSP